MSQQEKSKETTWSVVVIDMYHYMDPEDGERIIEGFLRQEDAIEYARRRTRCSLEEQRSGAKNAEDLRSRWFAFGEDCLVPGTGYKGLDDLDDFIANPATPEEIDWIALTPDPAMRKLMQDVISKVKQQC